jgi:hypothetical protein
MVFGAGGPGLEWMKSETRRVPRSFAFFGAGGPAFKIFGTKYEKGAPSLRFLQGRVRAACMMRFSGKSKNGTASCIVPTLRRVREEWGTRFIMASATERLGHPPSGMITYP